MASTKLMPKQVNYLNKNFNNFKSDLIEYAKTYFPQSYADFNEASPGMMFIEMASYVGDVMSYYVDSQFKESLLGYSEELRTLYSMAQTFGYKPRLFRIEEKLEQSGNNLPTFYATYNQYKEMIEEVRDELLVGIKWIRGACSNRKFRRAYGIKENFAEKIPTYEKYLEVLEKKDALLKSKTG